MNTHKEVAPIETAQKPLLVNRDQLREIFGINYSKATLLRKEKAGEFPQRLRLSPIRVAWPAAAVEKYIAGLETGAGRDVISDRIAAKHSSKEKGTASGIITHRIADKRARGAA